MKKLILSIFIGTIVLLANSHITQAAGACSLYESLPAEPVPPGQAVTVKVQGCTDPVTSYAIHIFQQGELKEAYDELGDLGGGTYSITILSTATWEPGNYTARLIDKTNGNTLRGTIISISDSPVTGPVGNLICDADNVWDPATRVMRSCVGGARTPDELRNLEVHAECLGNSNFPDGNICRGVFNSRFILGDYMDLLNPEVKQDDRGLWFTCFDNKLPRAVGKIRIDYSVNNIHSCSSEDTYTRPDDWDPFGEGLPWQEPHESTNSFKCTNLDNGEKGINTALGCIKIENPNTIYTFLLKWGLSIAGGVAMLTIIIACFLIIISRGDPERIKSGKELLSAAISGLLLLIFSIFILRIIGINILGIFQ